MKAFTGTFGLARLHLRAARRGLVLWGMLVTGLMVATAASIGALYPTAEQRRAYAASAGLSPAVAAVNGRGYDLTELGGITGYEIGFLGLVLFPVVAVHLALRFSRQEEDAGRTDLVTAAPLGRLAPQAAAVLTVSVWLVGVVLVGAVGLQAGGLPARGSWLYLVSIALFAGAYGTVGLFAAQVAQETRTAYGIGLGAVLVTYVVRALIDGRGVAAAWASPMGWLAEVRPWGDTRWWPLLAYAVLIAAALLLTAAVAVRRDLGGGLVAPRPGPERGSGRLAAPAGLAWRLNRAGCLGSLIGTAGWSAAMGALGGEMTDIVRANPHLLEVLGASRAEDLVLSLALLLSGLGGCCCGVQVMGSLAREEMTGRFGLLLSTRVPRPRAWLTWTVFASVCSVVVLWGSALALAAVTAWSTGSGDSVGRTVGAAVALVVPVLLVVAVTAVLSSVQPRAAFAGWALIAWATVVGMLAETLRLPGWARDLSPLHALGRVPVEDPRVGALLTMGLLVGLLVGVGAVRVRGRDLVAG